MKSAIGAAVAALSCCAPIEAGKRGESDQRIKSLIGQSSSRFAEVRLAAQSDDAWACDGANESELQLELQLAVIHRATAALAT
jgi:hypothetical protein